MEMSGRGKQRGTILFIKKTKQAIKRKYNYPHFTAEKFEHNKDKEPNSYGNLSTLLDSPVNLGIVLPAGYSQNANKSLHSPHTLPFTCFCLQMQPFIIAVKTKSPHHPSF